MSKLSDQIPEGTVATNRDGRKAIFRQGRWNVMAPDVQSDAPGAGFMTGIVAPKLTKEDSTALASYRNDSRRAMSARSDAMRFQDLNAQEPTGGLGGLPIVRDIRAAFDPQVSEMKAITEKLTPAQREPGSGTMSDADIAMYRAATVGLNKPRAANDAMAKVVRAGAVRQADYAAFMDTWGLRNGTLLGAQEAWNSYTEANPLFEQGANGNTAVKGWTPWRQWFGVAGGQKSPAPSAPKPSMTGGGASGGYKILSVED